VVRPFLLLLLPFVPSARESEDENENTAYRMQHTAHDQVVAFESNEAMAFESNGRMRIYI
jgi:hypothetical protein